jgi:hypothetical protein
LPKSKVLFREVYKNESKGKIMIRKFLVWKTNKEAKNSNYPAYVFNYTDFSSARKDPLKQDLRISSSEKQIMELANQFISKNIKKDWQKTE